MVDRLKQIQDEVGQIPSYLYNSTTMMLKVIAQLSKLSLGVCLSECVL